MITAAVTFLSTRAGKLVAMGLAVVLALAIQQARIDGFLWIEGWKPRALAAEQLAKDERANHVQTKANYAAAQKEAVAHAMAEKQATEARYAALQRKADHDSQIALDDAMRRAGAYAASNRVRTEAGAPAVQGDSRRADLSGTASAAQEPVGGRGDPFMVAVSRADFDACTLNTVRLQNAVEWAKGLGGK